MDQQELSPTRDAVVSLREVTADSLRNILRLKVGPQEDLPFQKK